MRDNLNDPPRGNLNTRDNNGGMIIGAIVAALVILGLFMWSPWTARNNTANNAPSTTVGSTTRPAAPASPTAPSTAPAAPYSSK